ncbi:hypothetical protein JMJ77_0010840, partial [Colletotrichum scovillei]
MVRRSAERIVFPLPQTSCLLHIGVCSQPCSQTKSYSCMVESGSSRPSYD